MSTTTRIADTLARLLGLPPSKEEPAGSAF